MIGAIEQDAGRFKRIVKGAIRRDLKRYISHREMFGETHKGVVSIPVTDIEIPQFRYGKNGTGGVGQGEGEIGESLGSDDPQRGGPGAGNEPGVHIPEVELTLDELAEILGEELALPRIQPRGTDVIEAPVHRYRSMAKVGPNSLLHFKRSFREALKRQAMLGQLDWTRPVIIIQPPDRRYREWVVKDKPKNNAVILYGMDVSGSMGPEEKDIVRHTAFWVDVWLKHNYRGLVRRFFLHDTQCVEVQEEEFYRVREGGGTNISSYLRKISEVIQREYPPSEWNIYPLYSSDGDNWGDDNPKCIELLNSDILPRVNMFLYLQVRKQTSGESFHTVLERHYGSEAGRNVAYAFAVSREDILDAIRTLLRSC